MSYVAGLILLHCGPPEFCFKVFCNVLNQEVVMSFYTFDLVAINRTYKVFWKLLRENCPNLYAHLREENVSLNVFLFEWVATLFSSSLDVEACAYLWDQIFFFGPTFILKAALGVCAVIARKFENQI